MERLFLSFGGVDAAWMRLRQQTRWLSEYDRWIVAQFWRSLLDSDRRRPLLATGEVGILSEAHAIEPKFALLNKLLAN